MVKNKVSIGISTTAEYIDNLDCGTFFEVVGDGDDYGVKGEIMIKTDERSAVSLLDGIEYNECTYGDWKVKPLPVGMSFHIVAGMGPSED